MKKTAIFISLFLISITAYSQRFVGSAILGMNATQVDGDEVFGFQKFGVNGGVSAMLALNSKQTWFATIELLYTQKGAYRRALVDSMYHQTPDNIDHRYPYDPKIKYRLRMDYVEIPVIFHYEDPKSGFAFGAGVSWGRLVRVNELENGWHLTTNLRSGTYKNSDWSVLADVKIRLWKGLKLNFRYQYSFIPVRTRIFTDKVHGQTWERKQYHNTLTLRLIYSFNEKYKLNSRTNKKGERVGVRWVRDTESTTYR